MGLQVLADPQDNGRGIDGYLFLGVFPVKCRLCPARGVGKQTPNPMYPTRCEFRHKSGLDLKMLTAAAVRIFLRGRS